MAKIRSQQIDRAIEAAIDRLDFDSTNDLIIMEAARIVQLRAGRTIDGAYDQVKQRFFKIYPNWQNHEQD